MNVLLGDTEETITTFVLDENNTKTKEVETKQRPLVFLRGDCIIAVANSFQ
jgi:small nuclear ribonucleoprotein (snRNP)-like protein